ncbi:hypothetical protein A9Q88_09880 [Gammaproteobacteria bacterium 50_400_T64]|nr:hypothetical protein A9Q88_09880 [Gammaproteobacteria bacterium 50_400_T64]
MTKWLLISALTINYLAFVWFTAQRSVDLMRRLGKEQRQEDLMGNIVLLSELKARPLIHAPFDDQAAKDELRVIESSLEAVASANLSRSRGRVAVPEISQGSNEGDSLTESLVRTEVLVESKPEKRCTLLGRFDKKSDMDGLIEKLHEKAGVTTSVNTVKVGLERYLVYMLPFEELADAKKQQSILLNDGVRSSLYHRGALKNGLSLGYFASADNANRRYDKLIAAGYSVMLKIVVTEITHYWIELGESELTRLSEHFWRDLGEEFPNVARKKVECVNTQQFEAVE